MTHPPASPHCPECGNTTMSFRREFDNFDKELSTGDREPISTTYVFECPCGYQATVTVNAKDHPTTSV